MTAFDIAVAGLACIITTLAYAYTLWSRRQLRLAKAAENDPPGGLDNTPDKFRADVFKARWLKADEALSATLDKVEIFGKNAWARGGTIVSTRNGEITLSDKYPDVMPVIKMKTDLKND